MDRLKDLWQTVSSFLTQVADVAVAIGRAVSEFLYENPGPAFTLVGALIAVLTARFVHYDRIRREHNARVRALLGEYVGAINALNDAKTNVSSRQGELVQGSGLFTALDQLKGKPTDPTVLALRSRLADARDARQAAQSHADSLFFQISIINDKSKEDLIFCAKALNAAGTESEYANAYNFALAVAARYFSDSRKDRSTGRRDVTRTRPAVVDDWDKYVAVRDAKLSAEVEPHSPSGAGHHGTDEPTTSETEGEPNGSRNHDGSGSSSGDRQ